MMTCGAPDAAGVVLDAVAEVAEVELVVALDDVVPLDDGLDDLLPLEHPATPATIVAAAAAINNSRFTKCLL